MPDGRPWYIWMLVVPLALLFSWSGISIIAGTAATLPVFEFVGAPQWLRLLMGFAELTCALGLLTRAYVRWAAILLGFIMIGATITQIIHGPAHYAAPALFVIAALLLILSQTNTSS